LVLPDRHVIVREFAEELGIGTGSVHSILTDDLAMRRVPAKFVPKLLTMEQKQLRLRVAQDMLNSANSDPKFLKKVTTGDESWVYGVRPGNQGAVVTVETLNVPEAKKGQISAEQRQSDVDRVGAPT
jgi:hypothetical protein